MSNNKNTKDYLHHYLGSETNYGKLVGVAISGEECKAVCLTKEGLILEGEAESITLRLRPLSDMTEEEAVRLCSVYSPEAFGDYRFAKWVAIKEVDNFCYNVKNKNSDMSFSVDTERMHIKIYEGGHDTYPGLENHTYFTEYLRMGFDIFGLIDAGLAIDKTKTP